MTASQTQTGDITELETQDSQPIGAVEENTEAPSTLLDSNDVDENEVSWNIEENHQKLAAAQNNFDRLWKF